MSELLSWPWPGHRRDFVIMQRRVLAGPARIDDMGERRSVARRFGRGGGAVLGRGCGRAVDDARDQRAHRHGFAFLDEIVAHRAGHRRRHLDRHLVGLEAGDRLVRAHRLARLLDPLAQRRFGNGLTQGRHEYVGRHDRPSNLLAPRLGFAADAERLLEQRQLLALVALGQPRGG
jgi:hypothetical protein